MPSVLEAPKEYSTVKVPDGPDGPDGLDGLDPSPPQPSIDKITQAAINGAPNLSMNVSKHRTSRLSLTYSTLICGRRLCSVDSTPLNFSRLVSARTISSRFGIPCTGFVNQRPA